MFYQYQSAALFNYVDSLLWKPFLQTCKVGIILIFISLQPEVCLVNVSLMHARQRQGQQQVETWPGCHIGTVAELQYPASSATLAASCGGAICQKAFGQVVEQLAGLKGRLRRTLGNCQCAEVHARMFGSRIARPQYGVAPMSLHGMTDATSRWGEANVTRVCCQTS